jgi:type IV pilus assembly protein PilM
MHTVKKETSQNTTASRFFNFFPPPSFLDLNVAGVDISDNSIKVLGLKQFEGISIPDFFEKVKISSGTISKGGIEDQNPLIETLSALRMKYGLNFIRASLPEEKAYLFKTVIPSTKDRDQVLNNIEFKLEEHVPIPINESIFDYDVIQEKNNKLEVSVTVFPKTTIANYQQIFKSAGLTTMSFILEGQAMANSVIPKGDTKTYMIIDFGRTRTGISIVKNGIVSFTSTIDIGGSEINRIIMKRFNVDDTEAESMKNKRGFINNKEDKELYESVIKVISSLRDEVNKHFVYWNSKEPDKKEEDNISKIILCGGSSTLSGLLEFLSLGIKSSIEIADVWQNVFSYDDYIPQINQKEALSYATAIGLTLV